MREEIKTANFRLIGYIEDEGSRLVAKDSCFRVLGYYIKSDRRTVDSSFRVLAYGNILSALIWEKR